MLELTQAQINDQLARQLALQWVSTNRATDAHTKTPNKDQLSRGLRVLQQESRLGMTVGGDEGYYYLRTEFQAACVKARPVLVRKLERLHGKVLEMGEVMTIALRYEAEIQKHWKSTTHKPHAFALLLPLLHEGVAFSRVEIPGDEGVCGGVKQVELAKEQPALDLKTSYVLTRENGWNEPLVGVPALAAACA